MQFRTSLRSSTVKLKILGHAKKANGALRFDPKRTNMVLLTTQGRERFRYGMKDLDSLVGRTTSSGCWDGLSASASVKS